MRFKITIFISLIFIFLNILPGQNNEMVKLQPIFIKATVYPTFSLARCDYNNDLDKVELRVYLELRDKKRSGEIIKDALVYINKTLIPFDPKKKDYRERININPEELINNLDLKINTKDGRKIKKSYEFPGWVIMTDPKPEILSSEEDIFIQWKYTDFKFPVTVHVYDYKKGTRLMVNKNVKPGKLILESKYIPAHTIIRLWVTADWFFKKYFKGVGIVRGSEINIIPWSQTFIRIKSKGN